MHRVLAGLIVVIAVLAARSSPASAEDTTLALPSLSPGFTAIYVAEDEGFWTAQGLQVRVSRIAGVGTINAVIGGSIDFSGSTAGTLIRAAVAGQRMLAIANLTDRPMDEIVLRKDVAERVGLSAAAPLKQRAAHLRGLKIAVDAINSINHGFLRYVARRGGLDPERDLTVAPMQSPTMAAALAAHAVDGLSISVPWTTAVEASGAAVALASVPDGDFPELVPFGGGLIVTRPELCRDKPTVCRKMGHGIREAIGFIRAHPGATLALLKPRFQQLPEPVLKAALAAYTAASPAVPALTERILANSQKFEINTGVIKPGEALHSFAGLYTDQYVR